MAVTFLNETHNSRPLSHWYGGVGNTIDLVLVSGIMNNGSLEDSLTPMWTIEMIAAYAKIQRNGLSLQFLGRQPIYLDVYTSCSAVVVFRLF